MRPVTRRSQTAQQQHFAPRYHRTQRSTGRGHRCLVCRACPGSAAPQPASQAALPQRSFSLDEKLAAAAVVVRTPAAVAAAAASDAHLAPAAAWAAAAPAAAAFAFAFSAHVHATSLHVHA
eukprot:354762-Chlamydomonas_euryale.AAC.2